MTRIFGIISLAVLAFIMPAPGRAATAAKAPPPVAALSDLDGTVTVVRAANSAEVDGLEDMDLFEGDEVRTAVKSAATITFLDKHLVKLSERTRLKIKTIKADPKTGSFFGRLGLLAGRMMAAFKPTAGDTQSGLKVDTRCATAAVKGTTFAVEDADSASTVSVLDGTVATAAVDAAGKEGAAVDVKDGQETAVDKVSGKIAPISNFLKDKKRDWMKTDLTGMKTSADKYRNMSASGDLDKVRQLRTLARDGKLNQATPELKNYMNANPGLKDKLKQHAERSANALKKSAAQKSTKAAENATGAAKETAGKTAEATAGKAQEAAGKTKEAAAQVGATKEQIPATPATPAAPATPAIPKVPGFGKKK